MVEYGKVLGGALHFCIEPKRWLPLFVLDAVAFIVVFSYLISNASAISSIIAGNVSDLLVASSIIGVIGVSVLVFIIWGLLRLYIVGALFHQSVKPKEYDKSWKVAKEKYLSLLMAGIIVGVISGFLSLIPYVGWILSIIIGLMFLFAMPAVIVRKMSFDDALRDSYKIFRIRTVDVFIVWLLITIITGIIIVIFLLPAMITLATLLLPTLVGVSAEGAGTGVLMAILAGGWSLAPAIIIYLIGVALMTVFSTNALAHFYLAFKKK